MENKEKKHIPKIIHLIWFGGGKYPGCADKCMASWKKFLPGWELKVWTEGDFDVNMMPYTAEAYRAKKYAFVSDVARYYILYNHGGLYMEFDVELIKSMDEMVASMPYMACEQSGPLKTTVASGLGFGGEKGNRIFKDLFEAYKDRHFIDKDGNYNLTTVVDYTTDYLKTKGLKNLNEIQQVAGITIFPQEFFNPVQGDERRLVVTEKTVGINHGAASWVSPYRRFKERIKTFIGPDLASLIIRMTHRKKH